MPDMSAAGALALGDAAPAALTAGGAVEGVREEPTEAVFGGSGGAAPSLAPTGFAVLCAMGVLGVERGVASGARRTT
jgi:hypothetical protein